MDQIGFTQEVTNDLITQDRIVPRAIKQRHCEALLIFTGLAANRPSGKTDTRAYFATDTNVLSIWNGTAWKSVTLA